MKAILGCVVHSIRFGTIELIPHAALIISPEGIIERTYNLDDDIDAKQFQTRQSQQNFSKVLDYSDKLILPGFVDAHCHAPQYIFTGTGMDLPLLQWLQTYTFPSEAKFANEEFARFAYSKSIKRHLKCGTTFASYFATIHNTGCKVLVDVINEVGQRAFVGKVSMDRNCPDFYGETTSQGCSDAEEFVTYVLNQTEIGKTFLQQRNLDHQDGVVKANESEEEENSAGDVSTDTLTTRSSLSSERSSPKSCSSPIHENTSTSTSTKASEFQLPSTEEGRKPRSASLATTTTDAEEKSVVEAFPAVGLDSPKKEQSLGLHDPKAIINNSTGKLTSLLNQVNAPCVLPCITPRFVPTCTPEIMEHLGQLATKYGLPIQSHMSESVNEILWVAELHPDCPTYAEVYEKYGLLNANAYMAHCCHSTDEERDVLQRTKASVVHCPSSNFMLSSGVMDVRMFLEKGIHVALGTDVAGGYSPSMLDALRQTIIASKVKGFDRQCYGAQNDKYHTLSYQEAFHLATVGGAEVLNMGDVVGNFLPGKKFDALIVDVKAENGPIDVFPHESYAEYFQKFIFLGDDRNIMHVYVDGKMVL